MGGWVGPYAVTLIKILVKNGPRRPHDHCKNVVSSFLLPVGCLILGILIFTFFYTFKVTVDKFCEIRKCWCVIRRGAFVTKKKKDRKKGGTEASSWVTRLVPAI